MKRVIMAILSTAILSAASAYAETYVLAEETDIQMNKTYEVLTFGAYREKTQEVGIAMRAFRGALIKAKNDWRKDETYGKKPFPSSSFAAPSIRSIARSMKSEELEEKLANAESRRSERSAADRDKDKKQDSGDADQRKIEWEREKQAAVSHAASLIETAMQAAIGKIQEGASSKPVRDAKAPAAEF